MERGQRGPAWLVASIILISITGNLGASLVPIAVGELIEPISNGGANYSLERAGFLQTLELIAIAIGSAAAPSFRVRGRAFFALGIALVASLASLFAWDLELFFFRAVAGFSIGVALGTAMSRVSDTSDPEAVYTWGTAANALAAFLALSIGGEVATRFGLMGILILLIAILVPGFVGSAWIGDVRAQTRVRQEDGTSLSTGGWLAVIALFLINLSISAVFAVLEPEAESLGVSKSTLGLVLGLGPLAGMALVIIQEKIFSRNSLYYTAIFHKIAAAVVVVIMLSVHNHVVFSICIVLSTALYYAAMPPNLTLGTLFGPGEQAGAYMSGSIVLGAALGPAIGGFVSGLGLLGALAALLFLGAALATGIAQFKLTRQDHREVM